MAEIKDLSTTDANNTGTAANAGFPENMAYSDVNNAARALEGMIARHFADSNGTLTTTGSSNAYLLTPNRTVAAYTAGDAYMIKASFTNTGAVTINVSSLGAKSIVKPSGDALAAGEITSGGIYAIIYDGTNFQMAGADDPENLTLTSLTVTGTTALNGNTTIGDAATDTVTITADVASDLIPSADGTHDLGAVGSEWQDLFIDGTANIDSLVADTADIDAGTIDGTVIGGNSAAAITGTTVTANTSLNIAGDGATVTGIKDEDDMASDSATKLATQQSIKAYVDSQVTAQDLDFQADSGGALSVDLDSQTFTLTGGTGIDTSGSGQDVTFAIDSTVATTDGSQTLTNKTLTSPVLNTGVSGTAVLDEDNMASDSDTQLATQQSIKAYVDAQITAEDLDFQADSGGALSVDLDSQTFTLTGGTGIDTVGSGQTVTFNIDSTVATLTGSQALTNKTIDVNSNTVSNIEVDNLKSGVLDTDLTSVAATDTTLASAKAIKTYVDSQVTAQDLDVTDGSTSIDIDLDSESLGILGGTGIDSTASGTGVTLAIDSTVATLTGTQTLTNKTLTSPDINTPDIDGGTIDNTVIGGTTAAAGTFTTFTSNGIDDNADATAITIDSSERVGIGGSPSHELDVISTTSGTSRTIRVASTASSGDNDATIIVSNGGSGDAMLRFDYEGSNTDRARIGVSSSAQQLEFYTAGNNLRMLIDSAGSVGIGVTPSAWSGFSGVAQVGNSALGSINNGTYLYANAYYDGSNNRYIATDEASRYYQLGGNHVWETAASGSADSVVSFSEAMRITSGGAVGVAIVPKTTNATVTGSFNVDEAGVLVRNSNQAYFSSNIYWDASDQLKSHSAGYGIALAYIPSDGSMRFFNTLASASGADQNLTLDEKMRLTSDGYLGVGNDDPSGFLHVSGGGTSAVPSLQLNSSTSDAFNHAVNAFNSNLTASEHNIFIIGKEGATKNSGYIGFKYNGDGSDTNLVTFGFWGVDNLMNLTGDGKLGIGLTDPSGQLHVKTSGTVVQHLESTATNGSYINLSIGAGGATLGFIGSASELITSASSSDLGIRSQGELVFATNGSTERVRVTTDGKFITTGTSSFIHQLTGSSFSWLAGTDNNRYNFYTADGNLRGYLTASGVFTDTSDLAYKKEIQDLSYGLAEVNQMQPRAYKMKINDEDQLGFIAQEMEQIIPEVVSGEDGSKGLAYGHLVPVLVKAIQEQQAIIQTLTERIEALEQ